VIDIIFQILVMKSTGPAINELCALLYNLHKERSICFRAYHEI